MQVCENRKAIIRMGQRCNTHYVTVPCVTQLYDNKSHELVECGYEERVSETSFVLFFGYVLVLEPSDA